MQRILNTTLTVKQLLIAMVILGFTITPWGLLYQQKQQWMTKSQPPPPVSSIPMANSPYPTLPPLNQLGKAWVLDNQAIHKLKTLVNWPTSARLNGDRSQSVQATPKLNRVNALTQRCWLDGQSYVAGDIVKTPNGWVRCSLTFSNTDNSSQAPSLNWLAVS